MINQYANSPTLNAILSAFASNIDPSANINAFYSIVWNIDSAQGFGLDIWGRIVGVARFVQIPGTITNFGFQDYASDTLPFGQGTFYVGPPATQTYRLTDAAYRVLILAKALTNIVRTTSPAINQVLQQMFPNRGACFVNDLGGMAMRYVFRFPLQPWEFSVLQTAGALPRPTGVLATIYQIPLNSFGFNEAGDAVGFGQGTFMSIAGVANAA